MPRPSALLLAVCLLLTPLPAGAQVTLGIGTGVGVLAGSDFDGNEGGTTLNLEAMVGPTAGFQFGGAVQYTSLGLEGRSETVGQIDVLAAARYMFVPDLAQLYVGARAGFSRQSWEIEAVERRSAGFSAGPTVGVILPFPWFGFEISMDARYIDFGEIEVDGTAAPGTDRSGVHVGGRVGLSFPLGS